MKKITLLIALLISSIGFSQAPTSAASTPPAKNAADVISIFTKSTDGSTAVYSDIAGINYNPNWGSTSGNVAEETLNGDVVMKYPAFHYQGIVINQNINISAMTMMHVDIWTNSISPNVFLISATTGEKSVNVTAKAGSWSSVEIPITSFTSQGMSVNDIKELKFDGGDSTTDIYIDNIYFYKSPADPTKDATLSDIKIDGNSIANFASATQSYTVELAQGTTTVPAVTATTTNTNANAVVTPTAAIPGDTTIEVTAQDGTTKKTYTVSFKIPFVPAAPAATPPTRNTWDVISLYSDAYTDVEGNLDAGWCGGNSFEKIMINGNETIKYLNNGCQGIVFNAGVDASAFTTLHVDYYIEDGTVLDQNSTFHLKFVQQPGGAAKELLGGTDAGRDIKLEVGKWVSVDITVDLTQFTGFKEFGITSNINGKIWYDNLYAYRAATASTENNKVLGFSMYPNPAKDELRISAKEAISKADVFNVLGRKVKSFTINSANKILDISDLSSGIYLVKYESAGKVGTAKFIKQ